MNQFLKSVISAAALVAVTAASATDVTVVIDTTDLSTTFTDTPVMASGNYSPWAEYSLVQGANTITGVAFAGEFDTSIAGGAQSFASYCFDIATGLVSPGAYTMNDTQIDSVGRLFSVAGFDGGKWATDGVSAEQTSALQVAIWEIAHDSLATANLSAGNLTFTSLGLDVLNQANLYLSQAAALTAGSYSAEVRFFSPSEGSTNQALVTTVPEPSTYALMAACLGIVGFVARRKSV